ncbi:MAG: WYL domain-containing protein [Deltaproteobacteria bacterium]|nr:WYL domain-containing protein [Deltaproteobacteria bacterium]
MPSLSRIFWVRVGALLSLLKRGSPVTVPILASKLEISKSSARRLIDALRDDFSAPLSYDLAGHTWVLEDPHWDLPTVPVSAEELAAFCLATGLLTRFPKRFSHAIRSFGDKLRMELEQSPDGAVLLELVSSNEPTWCRIDSTILHTVLRGLGLNHKIKIDYKSPWKDVRTQRVVEPKHLLLYNGTFYLVAYCELRKANRLFHLSFIKNAQLTHEPCQRPGLAIDDIMDAHGLIIGTEQFDVKVRLLGASARRAEVEIWHPEQDDRWDEQGRLVRIFPVRGTLEIMHRILSYGAEIEVLAPKRLREDVKQQVRRMAELHGLT